MLKELIHSKIDEIFLEMQNAEGITDGGIDPFDALYLDQLEEQLEQHIARIIKYQKGGIRMEYKRGQLIAVDGGIYEYGHYDVKSNYHTVSEIEIDEEGRLCSTYHLYAFTSEELENNKLDLTEKQWYGVVECIIRQYHDDLTEEEITEATEDIVGRCFVMNMPQFNEIEDYIAEYMNR